MMKVLALLILASCSTKVFRRPTPLPKSSDELCAPHYTRAFAKVPKSRHSNTTKYNYQALYAGLAARAKQCYQDYIETNLDRHQGRVACVSFVISKAGITHIDFGDVGVFNPPQPIKDCTISYLKSTGTNLQGQDRVFVEQSVVFFTRVSP